MHCILVLLTDPVNRPGAGVHIRDKFTADLTDAVDTSGTPHVTANLKNTPNIPFDFPPNTLMFPS